jgi:hypothetical protein
MMLPIYDSAHMVLNLGCRLLTTTNCIKGIADPVGKGSNWKGFITGRL